MDWNYVKKMISHNLFNANMQSANAHAKKTKHGSSNQLSWYIILLFSKISGNFRKYLTQQNLTQSLLCYHMNIIKF